MGPFLTQSFNLSPDPDRIHGVDPDTGRRAHALSRSGVLSQYIGRKNAAMLEMSLIIVAMIYGWLFVAELQRCHRSWAFCSASPAPPSAWRSRSPAGWFPAEHKGLAMGIAGAGNAGTVVALLVAPRVAQAYGWHIVYAGAAAVMLIPLAVMVIFAKEAAGQRSINRWREHLSCLFQADGWSFNLIYIITFGGFIGLSTFLPSFFYAEFGVTKVQAASLTMLAAIVGSGIRAVGGYAADRIGGIAALVRGPHLAVIATFLALSTTPSLIDHHRALHALLRGPRCWQRRLVPTRAACAGQPAPPSPAA